MMVRAKRVLRMRTTPTLPPIDREDEPPDDRELYGKPQHEDEGDDERYLYGDPQHDESNHASSIGQDRLLTMRLGDYYARRTRTPCRCCGA